VRNYFLSTNEVKADLSIPSSSHTPSRKTPGQLHLLILSTEIGISNVVWVPKKAAEGEMVFLQCG